MTVMTRPGAKSAATSSRTPANLWLSQLNPKTVLFYMVPLLGKWRKVFKTPRVGLIIEQRLNPNLWQKKLKATQVDQVPFEAAARMAQSNQPHWDLMIVFQETPHPEALASIIPLLEKNGALILVSRNLAQSWPQWTKALDDMDMAQIFPVGFHPQGAVAWWPLQTPWLLWLGKLIDNLAAFFPGRYQASLRYGQSWITKAIRREDITIL